MRLALASLAVAAGLAPAMLSSPARAAPDAVADLDRQFVCPEALPTDAARQQSLRDFVTAYAKAVPTSTVPDMLLYRRALLARHGCAKTLASLDAADAAVAGGKDVQVQAWLPVLKIQAATLSMSTDHLTIEVDPRSAGEKVVSAYMKLELASPLATNETHVTYDAVVSHELFYCGTGRHALAENVYFLAGAQVLREPEPFFYLQRTKEYQVVATDPHSFNAVAQRWACGASGQAT